MYKLMKFDLKIEIILIVLFCSTFLLFWEVPQALDLGRYYERAFKMAVQYPNALDYLQYDIDLNTDFIYRFILYAMARFGINLNIATIFFMSAYFTIALITWNCFGGARAGLVNIVSLCSLFSAPIIWSFTISRTLAAVVFLYAAIFFFFRQKYSIMLFFALMSFFTHISMLLFIVLLIFAFVLWKNKFASDHNIPLFAIMIFIAVFLSFSMNFFESTLFVFGMEKSRYAVYANTISTNFFANPYLGLHDKLPVLFNIILCLFCVIFNKKNDFIYWALFVFTIALVFFVFMDVMMTQRITIVMPLLIGCNLYGCLGSNKNLSVLNAVNAICCLSLLISLYNVFGYRSSFHFFI